MPLPPEVVESLPEDIRSDPSLESFNDVPSVFKGFIETKAMVGRSIQLPGKDTKPEDVEKWRGEQNEKLKERGYAIAPLGEAPPAKAEDYKIPEIEGVKHDPQVTQSYIKEVAHATGMTPKQVEANLKFHHKMNEALVKNFILTPDAAEAEFKNLMGADYEVVNQRATIGKKAFYDDHPDSGKLYDRLWVYEGDASGRPIGKAAPFNSHIAGKHVYETFATLTQEDHSDGGTPMTTESIEAIRAKMDEIRANDKMPNQRKAEALEPLYKQLVEAEKRQNGRAA